MDNLWKVFIQPERSNYDPRRLDPVERELDQSTKYIRHDGTCTNEYEHRLKFWLFEKTSGKVRIEKPGNNRGMTFPDNRNPNTSNARTSTNFWSSQQNDTFSKVVEPVTKLYGENSRDLRCMVYIHSHGGNCLEGMHLLRICHTLNMHLLIFDLTGHGLSEGTYSTLGLREHQDIECLLREVNSRFELKSFVLWGRSMGAVAALGYAARHPAMVHMLVLDSPFNSVEQIVRDVGGSYLKLGEYVALMMFAMIKTNIKEIIGHDLGEFKPIAYCDHLDIPCLFICAKDDELVRPERVQEMFANYRCVQRNLLLVDGNHSSSRTIPDMQKAVEYIAQVLKVQLPSLPPSVQGGRFAMASYVNDQPMKDKLEEIKTKFSIAQNGKSEDETHPRSRRDTMPSRNKGDEEVQTGNSYIEKNTFKQPALEQTPQKVTQPVLKASRSMTSLMNSPSLALKTHVFSQEQDIHAWKFGKRIFSPVKLGQEADQPDDRPKPPQFAGWSRPNVSIEPNRGDNPTLKPPVAPRPHLMTMTGQYAQVGSNQPAAYQIDSPGKPVDRPPVRTTAWSPRSFLQTSGQGIGGYGLGGKGRQGGLGGFGGARPVEVNGAVTTRKNAGADDSRYAGPGTKIGSSLLSAFNSEVDTTASATNHQFEDYRSERIPTNYGEPKFEVPSKHTTLENGPNFPGQTFAIQEMSYGKAFKTQADTDTRWKEANGPVRVLFPSDNQIMPGSSYSQQGSRHDQYQFHSQSNLNNDATPDKSRTLNQPRVVNDQDLYSSKQRLPSRLELAPPTPHQPQQPINSPKHPYLPTRPNQNQGTLRQPNHPQPTASGPSNAQPFMPYASNQHPWLQQHAAPTTQNHNAQQPSHYSSPQNHQDWHHPHPSFGWQSQTHQNTQSGIQTKDPATAGGWTHFPTHYTAGRGY